MKNGSLLRKSVYLSYKKKEDTNIVVISIHFSFHSKPKIYYRIPEIVYRIPVGI